MGMHATKDRVESDTSTVYSISLYGSTITTRDEPWFGELKLALGVIGLPVIVRDHILSCGTRGWRCGWGSPNDGDEVVVREVLMMVTMWGDDGSSSSSDGD
ncbi:hypothetical protein E3N88_07089 [Mikania micrantha]|uniref:Uncharacterized protein n=1 Tax=Mikania micrantha TaxID=192012 RepID=A0A5N6PQI7_9ASTR|nr:hypothetical protein E3N88_07089 [Mikania micrantha]